MGGELWAHSMNGQGLRHRLADHLRGAAALARAFGDAFGAGDLTGYLGLTHDVGKGGCAWRRGLLAVDGSRRPVGTDHKVSLAVRTVHSLSARFLRVSKSSAGRTSGDSGAAVSRKAGDVVRITSFVHYDIDSAGRRRLTTR